jgi:hypothetical protein
MKRKKLKKIRTLRNKLWKLISLHVRTDGSVDGQNTCFTCEVWQPIAKLNCGHFFHDKLDFDVRNLRAQCQRCNQRLHGNLGIFAIRLIKRFGMEWMDQLWLDAKIKGNEYGRQELMELIEQYK